MSYEILSQDSERLAHVNRVQNLMSYETLRRHFAENRWNLYLDSSLSINEVDFISRTASRLAVNIDHQPFEEEPDIKVLRFSASLPAKPDPISVQVKPDTWQLTWLSSKDNSVNFLELWKGVEINPLALKAREYRCTGTEIPDAGFRPVLGLHAPLNQIPIDIPATRELIKQNPAIFFLFVDTATTSNAGVAEKITEDLENALCMSEQIFGEVYHLYACFDAIWLPPLTGKMPKYLYQELLALAYMIGRPFLSPYGVNFFPAPFQFYYHPHDDSLDFIRKFDRSRMDVTILNDYLDSWSPTGSLRKLFSLANAASQEQFTSRPDFGTTAPPVVQPEKWAPERLESDAPVKCGIMINTLDVGGMENYVAQLARGLREYETDTFIICAKSGGKTAEELKKSGVRVYIAGGKAKSVSKVLAKEKPGILNTHLVDIEFLRSAYLLGIPVVETIHSSYVWHDQAAWQNERARSQYFTHAVTTSRTAKRYYLKWNNYISPDNITIVPTGIETEKLRIMVRNKAREKLGLSPDVFLFTLIASYDVVKNQLGLLTAFDEVAKKYPQVQLMCIGNIFNNPYYQRVKSYSQALDSAPKIQLYTYRQDVNVLLSASDVFVLNSMSEGWSIAATEALMAGVPLIHSNCGSAHALVGTSGERGIVVPNPVCAPVNLTREKILHAFNQTRQANTDALIEAMIEMVRDREIWSARQPEIRAYALQHFDIKITLQGYAKMFRQYSIANTKHT